MFCFNNFHNTWIKNLSNYAQSEVYIFFNHVPSKKIPSQNGKTFINQLYFLADLSYLHTLGIWNKWVHLAQTISIFKKRRKKLLNVKYLYFIPVVHSWDTLHKMRCRMITKVRTYISYTQHFGLQFFRVLVRRFVQNLNLKIKWFINKYDNIQNILRKQHIFENIIPS